MIFSYTGEGFIGKLRGADFGVISYSYNPSSVDELVYYDFGTLGATPTASADYGGINQETDIGAAAQADWGDIRQAPGRTRFPFGVVRLASSTTFKVKKTYVGTGQIFEFGGGRYIPLIPWIVTGTVSIRGAAAAAFGPVYRSEGLGTLQGAANAAFSTQYFGSGSILGRSFTGEAKATVYPEQPAYSDGFPIDYAYDLFTNNPRPDQPWIDTTLGTTLESGGTGEGNTGGFNIGSHIRFGGETGGTNGLRRVMLKKDLRNVDQLEIRAIKGNRENGGEEPDFNEDLRIQFASNFVDYFGDEFVVIPETSTDPNLQTIIINVPAGAQVEDSEFAIRQAQSSGTGTSFDHYGLASIRYLSGPKPVDGDTRKTLFSIGGEVSLGIILRTFGGGSLFTFGTKYATKTFAWEGSGSLFSIAGLQERNVYSYNSSSTYLYEKEDYQSVASATTEPNIDYGQIIPDDGDDVFQPFDYGDLANVVSFSDYPFGTLRLKSETTIAFQPNWIGSGTLFAFSNAITKGPQNHYGSGTFHLDGTAVIGITVGIFGGGNLFGFGGGSESIQYAGEEKQVLLEFGGVAAESAIIRDPVQGTSLSFGSKASNTRFIPRFFGNVLFDIEGGITAERSTFSEVASGNLFSFVGKEERRTYSYNTSSIDFLVRPDYGYIANAATEEVDHGTLDLVYYPETGWISTPDARLDYQYITDVATIYPFGILPLTSNTEIAFQPNWVGSGTLRITGEVFIFFPPVHEGEGSFHISGTAEERFVSDESFQTLFEFNGFAADSTSVREIFDIELHIAGAAEESFIANPPERPVLFTFVGDTITSFIPRYNGFVHIDIDGGLVAERSTFSEVVEGNLFSFVSKEERRTYHYNTSSINLFETPDYGYISQVATHTEDHGYLETVYYPETGWISLQDTLLDYEYITGHATDYPFGIFPLKGEAQTPRTRDYIGSGDLFTFGDVFVFVPPVFSGEGTFTIGGTAEERFISNEVFQTLFEFNGEVADSTSVREIFDVHLEIFGAAEESFIGNPPEEQILFTTRGIAVTSFIPRYNGSVEIDIDGGLVAEKATFSEVVDGNLFSFIGKEERRVYSYNNSSIDFFDTPDLGSVASAPDSGATNVAQYPTQDYGYLNNVYYPETGWISLQDELIDWQSITEHTTNYPFGLFKIVSGSDQDVVPVIRINYFGSGSLFTIGDAEIALPNKFTSFGEPIIVYGEAAERFIANPPDKQVLFDITGQVSEPILTFAEQPFGTISISGFVNHAFTGAINPGGVISIDVEAATAYTPNFSGSGSIFSNGVLGEALVKTFPEDVVPALGDIRETLFNVSGSATLKSTSSETGLALIKLSGDAVPVATFDEVFFTTANIFGEGQDRFIPSYTGEGFISTLSGAAEAFAASPDDLQVLFDITGNADKRFVFAAPPTTGDISILGGIPRPATLVFAESGFGSVSILGEVSERFVPNFNGSGTIFAAGISGEAITVDLPAFTRAHLQISGSAAEAFVLNPPDITTNVKFGGDVISSIARLTFAEQPTVLAQISGQVGESYLPNNVGSGSIASRGIGGEAVSRKLPAFQADVFVSGLAGQSTTVREQFFGSLFTFRGSSAPELLTFAEQPEVQIAISGTATERFIPDYVGDILIGTFSGAAESVTINPIERELLFTVRGGITSVKATKSEVKTVNASIFSETVVPLITKSYIGSGTLHLSGESVARFTATEVGTGFISTLSGAAESATFNPAEDTALFEFSGISTIRSAVSEVKFVRTSVFNEPVKVYVIKNFSGEGTLNVSGDGIIKISLLHIGSGSISTLSGAAEAITASPTEDTALFDLTGIADVRKINVYGYYGDDADPGTSGSLFAVGGAAESRAIVNTTEGIFNISGAAAEAFAVPFAGFGNLFGLVSKEERRTFAHQTTGAFIVSGQVEDVHVRDYEGSGSLFSFIDAEESFTKLVPAKTTILTITGEAVVKISAKHFGSGDLYLFDSAAEARTIPVTAGIFGEFFGVARRKVTRAEVASGTATISGESANAFSKGAYAGSGSTEISGQSENSHVRDFTGQVTVDLDGQVTVIRTQAYTTTGQATISGDAFINISPANPGSGTIFVSGQGAEIGPLGTWVSKEGVLTIFGNSATRKVSVAPQRTYGWII